MTVKTRRIYDHATEQDGYRVLVDRVWPRGVSKDQACLDEWCKEVAPSTELRKWYGHRPELFDEFDRRYRTELASGQQATALLHLRELTSRVRTLTLLTASKDLTLSKTKILAELLAGSDVSALANSNSQTLRPSLER